MFDPYAELLENEWFDEYASDDYSYDNDPMYFEDSNTPGKTKFQDITDKIKTAIELLIAKIKMKVEEIMAKVSSTVKDIQQKMTLKKMQKDMAKSGAPENRMIEVGDVWAATNFWKANSAKLWSLCDDFFTKDYKDIRSMENDTAKLKNTLLNIENKVEVMAKKKKKITLKQFQEFLKTEVSGSGNIRKVQKEVNEHLLKLKAKNEYLAKKAEILQKNNMVQYEQPTVKKANFEKGKVFSERGKRALSIIGMVGFTTLKVVSVLYLGMTIANMIGGGGGAPASTSTAKVSGPLSGMHDYRDSIGWDKETTWDDVDRKDAFLGKSWNDSSSADPWGDDTDSIDPWNDGDDGTDWDSKKPTWGEGYPKKGKDLLQNDEDFLQRTASKSKIASAYGSPRITPDKVSTGATNKALFNSIDKKLPGFENLTDIKYNGNGPKTTGDVAKKAINIAKDQWNQRMTK